MTTQGFDEILDKTFEDLKKINVTKGREYAGSHDRLANFKRQADKNSIAPEVILNIYMTKHIDAVDTFIKDIQNFTTIPRSQGGKSLAVLESALSEPIEGRINDVIMYCILLKGLIEDRRQEENKKP